MTYLKLEGPDGATFQRDLAPEMRFTGPRLSRRAECYPRLSVIHLDLQSELEARLTIQAEARGLALDRYLKDLITAQARESAPVSPAEAVAQIRELRKGLSLGGLSIKDLVSEGRKY